MTRCASATRRAATLRLILSSLRSAEKELQRPLSDDEELQVLQRERKRRHSPAEAFRAAGREAQAEAEEAELDVLEEFMPEPLTDEEIEEIIDDVIAEVSATSMRDLGRVMADVMPQIAGRADGVRASASSSARSSPRNARRAGVPKRRERPDEGDPRSPIGARRPQPERYRLRWPTIVPISCRKRARRARRCLRRSALH